MMLKVLGMAHEQAVKGLIRDAFSAEPWCDRWEDEDVFHSYILDVMGNQNSLALGLFSEDVLIGISLGRLPPQPRQPHFQILSGRHLVSSYVASGLSGTLCPTL